MHVLTGDELSAPGRGDDQSAGCDVVDAPRHPGGCLEDRLDGPLLEDRLCFGGNGIQAQVDIFVCFLRAQGLKPGKGGMLARSAGAYGTLTSRDGKYAIIKLPSGESRMVLTTCRATIGITSNGDHGLEKSGKAGRSRWKGRRPRVRGVAMNPVDHPMGGGEGRASGGHPRSRNGMPAKGYKTRSKKKYSDRYIVEKRKTKK